VLTCVQDVDSDLRWHNECSVGTSPLVLSVVAIADTTNVYLLYTWQRKLSSYVCNKLISRWSLNVRC
jgi:oxalate decarboxylase/phosphoglucose isomerase-like protein (cupin superfamily)